MSNSNTNLQTQSSNALHNAIMEAGSKDRPPMLAPGNYVEWKSRIKRYIDTKPNSELIHHCLQNPPYTYQWAEKTVPVAEGSSETTTERYMENYKNVSQDIRDQLNAEAEVVQIILTGIDNDIYSTGDACPNACEMWKAIERLKQGESINVQDLETNLYWEFGKFTSRDGESLESYYSRFYKMMNELVRNQCHVTNHQVNVQFLLQLQPEWQRFMTLVKQSQELKTVSYHKLYDILKQHQNEVNEIRAERLACAANLVAFVAQQQPVYHPQNHPTQNTQYSSTRSQQSTRNRGKAIVTSSAPTYDPEPATKIYKPTNNNLQTSSNTSRANQDNSPRINRGTGYDNQRAVNVARARENVAYHKEKMLLCKQEEVGVQLNAEQADWKDDTDDESDDQELEAHYMYMAQIQEVTPDPVDNSGPIFDDEPMHKVQNNNDNYNVFAMENEHPEQPESSNDIYLTEQGDTNITIDSSDICYDRAQDDQDETDDLDQERDLLASLIQKLKCEIDDNKNQNKFLESSNKALVDKLKGEIEDFKTKNKSLESSNNHFKEANNELSKTNQLMFKDLKKFQAELDKYNDVNYASKVEIDCAKAKGDLMSYKIDFEKSSNAYTQKINDLNQTISDMKKELCAHQETISIMSQAKEAQIKLYKTREDKELDKVIALENKVKVLNDIVYKTGQSVQTMNMLNRNCKTSFAKPEFLKKSQRANPRLYDIGCYNDNLALMLALESDETIRLDKESRSKLSDLIRPFDYDQLNNLYELEYYYDDHMNAILGVYTDLDEVTNLQCDYLETLEKCEHLEKELSKSRTMSKSFEALQKHAINLELDLQQCKEKIKNDKSFKENQSNVFLKEREQYFEIQDLKAQLQDKGIAISELKKLIEKMKGKSVETKFEKSSVIRQPNAFKSQRQSILGKPAIFSDSLAKTDFSKSKSVTTQNVSHDFSKPVTAQILPQNVLPIFKNTNVIAPGMYKVHTKPNQTRTQRLPQDIGLNKPIAMPISTREPKHNVNQSIATSSKKTVATDSTVKKSRIITRKLYEKLVEIILFIVYSGCSKHMTGNLKLLTNFVEKFLGMVKFGNDQIAPILGYGDLGNDLLTGSRDIDLYSITLQDTPTSNPICLMAKTTLSQAWLWHRRLSHLNFDTINLLSKNNIVNGLPKLKFFKDHLCSSCELGKAKRKYFHTKTTPSSKRQLQLLHMDLCGPMRVESINGKKYVLVIIDDYSRYTWTHFLRSKDETPEVLIDFLTLI
ncbi:retrovirus-related pol polyprotein from transposon TNT 1-94 [Tanacetum coccineum]